MGGLLGGVGGGGQRVCCLPPPQLLLPIPPPPLPTPMPIGAQTMPIMSSVDLAHYGVARAKIWGYKV